MKGGSSVSAKALTARDLKALFVAEDIRAVTGGVPAVVKQLSERLSNVGASVQIAYALGQDDDLPSGVKGLRVPPDPMGKPWAWSRKLAAELKHVLADMTGGRKILHVHGIWAAPQLLAARSAARAKVPFILTPHGMLEPWLWKDQGWLKLLKKSVYWQLLAYPAFRHASVIHAITRIERNNLRELFPDNRIEIIPNAVETRTTSIATKVVNLEKRIAFLGRIDPKKGVDILIEAFARAELNDEWRLDIAGPTWSDMYMGRLRKLVKSLGLESRIRFLGPLFGDEKTKLLQSAWILATPSHSEAIGLVNLEAAILGTPAVTTPQTGLHDWELGGGLLAEPRVETFAVAIKTAARWSLSERTQRGEASRKFVEAHYGWEAVLPAWIRLYESLAV